jgi:hypothetical protein
VQKGSLVTNAFLIDISVGEMYSFGEMADRLGSVSVGFVRFYLVSDIVKVNVE